MEKGSHRASLSFQTCSLVGFMYVHVFLCLLFQFLSSNIFDLRIWISCGKPVAGASDTRYIIGFGGFGDVSLNLIVLNTYIDRICAELHEAVSR